jgi:hypothetical protein
MYLSLVYLNLMYLNLVSRGAAWYLTEVIEGGTRELRVAQTVLATIRFGTR